MEISLKKSWQELQEDGRRITIEVTTKAFALQRPRRYAFQAGVPPPDQLRTIEVGGETHVMKKIPTGWVKLKTEAKTPTEGNPRILQATPKELSEMFGLDLDKENDMDEPMQKALADLGRLERMKGHDSTEAVAARQKLAKAFPINPLPPRAGGRLHEHPEYQGALDDATDHYAKQAADGKSFHVNGGDSGTNFFSGNHYLDYAQDEGDPFEGPHLDNEGKDIQRNKIYAYDQRDPSTGVMPVASRDNLRALLHNAVNGNYLRQDEGETGKSITTRLKDPDGFNGP